MLRRTPSRDEVLPNVNLRIICSGFVDSSFLKFFPEDCGLSVPLIRADRDVLDRRFYREKLNISQFAYQIFGRQTNTKMRNRAAKACLLRKRTDLDKTTVSKRYRVSRTPGVMKMSITSIQSRTKKSKTPTVIIFTNVFKPETTNV